MAFLMTTNLKQNLTKTEMTSKSLAGVCPKRLNSFHVILSHQFELLRGTFSSQKKKRLSQRYRYLGKSFVSVSPYEQTDCTP